MKIKESSESMKLELPKKRTYLMDVSTQRANSSSLFDIESSKSVLEM